MIRQGPPYSVNTLNSIYRISEFPRKLFFFEFGNPKVTVHKCGETILREETIQGRKLYE